MKICLYPNYIEQGSASAFAPDFFEFLEQLGVVAEDQFHQHDEDDPITNYIVLETSYQWRGDLETLPKDEPMIIRWSSQAKCNQKDFLLECKNLGHLTFYDRWVADPENSARVAQFVQEYLQRTGKKVKPKFL